MLFGGAAVLAAGCGVAPAETVQFEWAGDKSPGGRVHVDRSNCPDGQIPAARFSITDENGVPRPHQVVFPGDKITLDSWDDHFVEPGCVAGDGGVLRFDSKGPIPIRPGVDLVELDEEGKLNIK